MKKTLTAALAGLALTLTACGQSEEEKAQASQEAMLSEFEQKVAPPEGVTPEPTTVEISEGDVLPITCYSHLPCDGSFTVESVTMSDACEGRVEDYGMGTELEEGQTYLQISGVFELPSAANGWSMLDDPQIINSEGFTENTGMATNCQEDGEYQSWSSTLDVGQKSKNFGAWIVPEDAEVALFPDGRINLPDTDDATEIIPESTY